MSAAPAQPVPTAQRRLRVFTVVLGAALLSAVFMSPRLWTTERAFPTVPVLDGLPDLPHGMAVGLTGLLVVSVLGVAVVRRPGRMALLPVALGVVLVLFDMNRLQPWFYQYLLMYAALGFVSRDADPLRANAALAACAFIVVAVYVWSGAQKANLTFATQVFPALVGPLGDVWASRLQPFWFVAPVLEAAAGVLLWRPRTRAWGLAAVAAMHACILLALGPLGQNVNPIVWPWNVCLPVMAGILLYRNGQPVLPLVWSRPFGRVLMLVAGVMPSLSVTGQWDGPLSASLYSGRLPDAWIYLTGSGVEHMPARYRDGNDALTLDAPDRFRIDVTRWAEQALNVPPYAEPRVYRGLLRKLEAAGVPRGEMTLLVRDDPGVTGTARTYSAVRW